MKEALCQFSLNSTEIHTLLLTDIDNGSYSPNPVHQETLPAPELKLHPDFVSNQYKLLPLNSHREVLDKVSPIAFECALVHPKQDKIQDLGQY